MTTVLCKHPKCTKGRHWRLWAVGYCYTHAVENKKSCEARGVYR